MSTRRGGAGRVLLVLALVAAWASPALPQNVAATIHGTASDTGGDGKPGVQVVVKNVGTGAAHERTTDGEGRYAVPQLPPGDYEVQFSLTGFQTVSRRGLRLTVGQDAVVNASLSVGQLKEEVVVQANV